MVEQQLEGDKVADLGPDNLVAAPVLEIQALPSTFSSSLLSWLSSPMDAILDFRHST